MTGFFPLQPDSIIYVLCPARIVTGGPEAIHQLVHKLKGFGHAAKIVPIPDVANPALLQYRNYRVDFAHAIEDHVKHVLVTTEVNPGALKGYQHIRKAVWWLSVDFHQTLAEKFDFSAPENQGVIHFAQSAYAHSFLLAQGVEHVFPLSDYLNELYLRQTRPVRKNDWILYTPVKGAEVVVDRLKRADPTLRWLALKGMTKNKHAQTMRQGKVYVDFGSHPGKDRQPREAAVNGCCVVVGLAGSTRFAQDMPIPDDYKFAMGPGSDGAILRTLHSCLTHYAKHSADFSAYAERVRQEEWQFEQEVQAIFGLRRRTSQNRVLTNLRNVMLFAKQNDPPTLLRALLNEFCPPKLTHSIKNAYLFLTTKLPIRGK